MAHGVKLLSLVIALTLIRPETAISAGGDALCKEWELASRTYYPNKHELYDEINKWIIGQVLGSPIWPSSEIGKLINDRFTDQNHSPHPTDTFTGIIMRVTDIALDYCTQHPNDTIAMAAKMISAIQDKEGERKRIGEKASAVAKMLQELQNQERLNKGKR